MSDERFKMPPERDFGFYQRRKHDKWRVVESPQPPLEAVVADSHAHVHLLPDPAWELARCAANGIDFLCMIVDPSEDGARPFDELDGWLAQCRAELLEAGPVSFGDGAPDAPDTLAGLVPFGQSALADSSASGFRVPDVCIATGVHPHNAKLYDDAMERELRVRLADPRVRALGEVGLDYHYDFSPRDVQRDVFRRQIALAKEFDLPIALHLRDGESAAAPPAAPATAAAPPVAAPGPAPAPATATSLAPATAAAHAEALAILQEEGLPERGVLLHCCTLGPEELRPWIDAGCYVAYGGALTFKAADAVREGARLVPEDRLLVETDTPYMTPEPMRGATCTPAHVVFTAARLAEVRGIQPGPARGDFLVQLHESTLRFYRPR